MKDIRSEFTEEINKIVSEQFNNITNSIPEEFLKTIVSFKTRVVLSEEQLSKYGIDSHEVTIFADFDAPNDVSISFHYGSKIEPIFLFKTPTNVIGVYMLDIIKEAIKQNTNRPDIKHLQTPEGEEPIYETNENNKVN